MTKDPAAKAAGVHYLEYESMELETGGKTWKVYGSPVCPLFSNIVCVSDFAQATPRFMMGSFQYEEQAEAEGERPLTLF